MDIDEVREASHILEKIDRHDELYKEIKDRDVDFVENERVRPLGRMEMDQREINELKGNLKLAVREWFYYRRTVLVKELEAAGVEIEPIIIDVPLLRDKD